MVLHSFKTNIQDFVTTLSHVGLRRVEKYEINLMKGGVFND